jgi:hypothetical protein
VNSIVLTHPGGFEELEGRLEIRTDQGVQGRWEDGALVFDFPVSGTITVGGST